MLRRILHSTVVLAVLIGAYQAYVTFAVPRMEPPLAVREQRAATIEEYKQAKNAVSKYQRLLAYYFPADHWSQLQSPKVFANATGQAMLVIDEYVRHEETGDESGKSTQVDIKRFAMLMFPKQPHAGLPGPSDAVVLEAEQGARLIFDDFHPELGRIGQITRGEFPGVIRIRSDMHDPGPEDDLLVETADLQMNTKLLYTASPVRFRMGQNVGGGRELEIRFLADEHLQPREAGLKIAGFDTLEIRRDVRMRMELDTAKLLPGGEKEPSLEGRGSADVNPVVQVSDAKVVAPAAPKPPVEVTCNGPFTFDFVRYVASVDKDVEVRQLNPNGPCDQLTCNQLDIHFAAKILSEAKAEAVVVDPGKRQQRDFGRLEPVGIVASGHPAIVVSPAKKAEVRGDRIQISMREQRMRIEGGSDTRLTSGTNVLQAPMIGYQQPPRDSASQIGNFFATGPGSLHFVPDATKPNEVFQAAWQTSVQLGREQGQPVIVMEGRPEMAFAAAGSILGDQIRLYLRELDGTATAGLAIGGSNKQKQARLAPDRLIAVGRVKIASAQITGRTQKLLANFQIQPEAPAPVGGVGQPSAVATVPAAQVAAAVPSLPAAKPDSTPGRTQSQQSYQVVADRMQLEVLLKGQSAVPARLACDGNIVLREVPLAATEQQPMEICGSQLFVDKLDTKAPHVTLKGAGGTQPAQLSGRGITLLTAMVEMDGSDNRMWSDGPGEATALMTRDLQGNVAAAPTPVKIQWQGGLKFDGQTITFDRDVVVSSADSTLKCDRMLAKLAAPLKFGQHLDQSATSFSQVECEGKVTIENLTRDTGGVTAHDRMELGRLTINQQTGAIYGEGPGIIRSTRYGAGLGPLAGPGKPQAAVSPLPGASGSKLHFLRVDFHDGLEGNMYTRELTFHKRVRTVYGPVDAWEQELEPTRPETLPPESMTLSCDDLRLNEDPHGAKAAPNPAATTAKPMGPLQLQAKGNVRIDGQSASQGQFRIQADRASYEQSKDAFILEGDLPTPAKLWRRTPTGVDSPPLEARKIFYSRTTNQAKVDGIQRLEISPQDLEKAQRPGAGPTR